MRRINGSLIIVLLCSRMVAAAPLVVSLRNTINPDATIPANATTNGNAIFGTFRDGQILSAWRANGHVVRDVPHDGVLQSASFVASLSIYIPENDEYKPLTADEIVSFGEITSLTTLNFGFWPDGIKGGPASFVEEPWSQIAGTLTSFETNEPRQSEFTVEDFGMSGVNSVRPTVLVTLDLTPFHIEVQKGQEFVFGLTSTDYLVNLLPSDIQFNDGANSATKIEDFEGDIYGISSAFGSEPDVRNCNTVGRTRPGGGGICWLADRIPQTANGTLLIEGTQPWTQYASSLQYTVNVPEGDFDLDNQVGSHDIDLLAAAIAELSTDLRFDVNGDELVDASDRTFWVHNLANTYFGDSNLDGEFNTGDLVAVFSAGEYEDTLVRNSTWSTGDWNGDREFDSGDLVVAFSDGGFENGPRATAVPEPGSFALLLIAPGGIASLVRRYSARNRRC